MKQVSFTFKVDAETQSAIRAFLDEHRVVCQEYAVNTSKVYGVDFDDKETQVCIDVCIGSIVRGKGVPDPKHYLSYRYERPACVREWMDAAFRR